MRHSGLGLQAARIWKWVGHQWWLISVDLPVSLDHLLVFVVSTIRANPVVNFGILAVGTQHRIYAGGFVMSAAGIAFVMRRSFLRIGHGFYS